MQDLGVYAVETVKVRDVSHDPDLIAVEEDDFSGVGIRDAWGQIGRQKDGERYGG